MVAFVVPFTCSTKYKLNSHNISIIFFRSIVCIHVNDLPTHYLRCYKQLYTAESSSLSLYKCINRCHALHHVLFLVCFICLFHSFFRCSTPTNVRACVRACVYARLNACVRSVCLIVLITIFSGNTAHYAAIRSNTHHPFLFSFFVFGLDEFLRSLKLNVTIYSLVAATTHTHTGICSSRFLSVVFQLPQLHIYDLLYKTFDGIRSLSAFFVLSTKW